MDIQAWVGKPAGCIAILLLASCASTLTVPVAVVTKASPSGIMRGSNTITGLDASFEVSDGKLSCAGTYSIGNPSTTITIPVLCNDGRKGLVTATREYGGMSGGGRFTLNDGSTGDFVFGAAASRL
ncbi:hypothetical protein [uncultured Bradyrhizobium sp.]|uniref:hypothetical protein n=1 Tax=uncultured Bradyrhizobium sp. TaxID=199684 RepID=UPI00262844CF|nr:hypothetical protein [uncultured Bradyrhizobium sp.]